MILIQHIGHPVWNVAVVLSSVLHLYWWRCWNIKTSGIRSTIFFQAHIDVTWVFRCGSKFLTANSTNHFLFLCRCLRPTHVTSLNSDSEILQNLVAIHRFELRLIVCKTIVLPLNETATNLNLQNTLIINIFMTLAI